MHVRTKRSSDRRYSCSFYCTAPHTCAQMQQLAAPGSQSMSGVSSPMPGSDSMTNVLHAPLSAVSSQPLSGVSTPVPKGSTERGIVSKQLSAVNSQTLAPPTGPGSPSTLDQAVVWHSLLRAHIPNRMKSPCMR